MFRASGRLLSAGFHLLEIVGRSRTNSATELSRHAAALCRVHGIQIEVKGELPSGGVVLVANHLGYADPLVVASQLPCAMFAWSEILDLPVIGRAAKTMDCLLFVRRGDPMSGAAALRRAARQLRTDLPVLGFPEGTAVGRALSFNRGLFGVALQVGCPVVPVQLDYAPRQPLCGSIPLLPDYMKAAEQPQTTATIRFGSPLCPRLFSTSTGLARATRQALAQLHRRP
jgi:1-acyl-sn-glycerol-3-phosphate acyltransferase